MVIRLYYYQSSRLYKYKYTTESDPLEYCYLTNDEIAMRLRVLSNNVLLGGHSFRRFRACVPSGHRTKAGLTKFIMDDFGRQANKPNINKRSGKKYSCGLYKYVVVIQRSPWDGLYMQYSCALGETFESERSE